MSTAERSIEESWTQDKPSPPTPVTDHELIFAAGELFLLLRRKRLTVVTAESCTAGLVAKVLSDAPGAADILHGGFITYTKLNKICSLGLTLALIEGAGIVSRDVAVAMAEGALQRCPADLAVAITGVAGPEPEQDGSPVGLVCVAGIHRGAPALCVERRFPNLGRYAIRNFAAREAIRTLIELATGVGAVNGNRYSRANASELSVPQSLPQAHGAVLRHTGTDFA